MGALGSIRNTLAFPFAGVNVEATGTEKIEYSIDFFLLILVSLTSGATFILKASDTVGV